MQQLNYFILVPMVYIAFAVFFIGTVVRLVKIFKSPKNPSTLRIYPAKGASRLGALADTFLFPTVLKHKPILWLFLMIFHGALVLLLIGHLELVRDWAIFQIIPHDVFIGNGFVGLLLLVCILYFLFRRMMSPVKELSVPEDYFMLIALFLVCVFGSEMDWARQWYEYGEMGVYDYQDYLGGLITFSPALPDAVVFSGHSFMLVLHVLFANLLLIYFPFSNLMHAVLSFGANKLRRG